VEATTSQASQVNLFRDGTASNWARMIRTTTTGTPTTADRMFVAGEWTAAGTKTDRVVTMNSTAATDYGDDNTTIASLGVSKGGTIAYGVSAATAYVLRLSGVLNIWREGIWTMGTVATPMPRDSTAVLEFDAGADNPVEVVRNSEWLLKMDLRAILELMGRITAQRLLERDMFQVRMKKGEPLGYVETIYPLLQGYDSVAMEVDAEVGGRDQLFNMLVGRDLVRSFLGKDKHVFIGNSPSVYIVGCNPQLITQFCGNFSTTMYQNFWFPDGCEISQK
jgi:hypothetical protein